MSDRLKVELVGVTTSSKNKQCGAYTLEHPSGKRYHGSTDNLHRRLIEHRGTLSRKQHGNVKLQELVADNPVLKVNFIPTDSIETARLIESNLIAGESPNLLLNYALNTSNPLLGLNENPEVRERLKNAKLGNQNAAGSSHTAEWKTEQSRRMKGNQHLLGHKHSKETRKRMSEAAAGKTMSPEAIERAAKGRTKSSVEINGEVYFNLAVAAGATGLSRSGVEKRCKSEKYPNWKLIPKVQS